MIVEIKEQSAWKNISGVINQFCPQVNHVAGVSRMMVPSERSNKRTTMDTPAAMEIAQITASIKRDRPER